MASIRENSKVASMTTKRSNDQYHILINEILHRLPAKSLCRFKCVCKHLNTLISSPEFINFHLNLALDINHVFVFAYDFDEEECIYKRSLYTYNLDDKFSKLSSKKLPIPLGLKYSKYRFFFAGSCNGLHCTVRMSSIYLDINIFNPSTGMYKRVEVTDLAFHGASSIPITKDKDFTNFGFGFDDVNDDYKVVKVTYDYLNDPLVESSKVMVYSVKTNSWRRAQNCHRSLKRYHTYAAAVIDNHLLHWLIISSPLGQVEIACFDICNETWREDVMWPNSLVTGSCSSPQLGVLDGNLYLFFDSIYTDNYDIWVMKEYGVKESWVKLFEIDYRVLEINMYRFRVLGYTNKSKDEILIWDGDDQSRLVWFDVKNNNVKRVKKLMIDGNHGTPKSSIMGYVCNGTLVNIPGGRPLPINKGFQLKDLFGLGSRRRGTKGRSNNDLAKQQQQMDFNLRGRQKKRLMNK